MPLETGTARMDLSFSLAERFTEGGEPAGIAGTVEFRTDVFDAASIEVLIARLERVLEAMTADPARRVSSIDVLDEAEHAGLDQVSNRAVLSAAGELCRCRFRRCSLRRWRARRRRWRSRVGIGR